MGVFIGKLSQRFLIRLPNVFWWWLDLCTRIEWNLKPIFSTIPLREEQFYLTLPDSKDIDIKYFNNTLSSFRVRSSEYWTCGRKMKYSHLMLFIHCLTWWTQTIQFIENWLKFRPGMELIKVNFETRLFFTLKFILLCVNLIQSHTHYLLFWNKELVL